MLVRRDAKGLCEWEETLLLRLTRSLCSLARARTSRGRSRRNSRQGSAARKKSAARQWLMRMCVGPLGG
jgi:hypothetical protein